MLYQETSVTVHIFKGAPMADKMIKDSAAAMPSCETALADLRRSAR